MILNIGSGALSCVTLLVLLSQIQTILSGVTVGLNESSSSLLLTGLSNSFGEGHFKAT